MHFLLGCGLAGVVLATVASLDAATALPAASALPMLEAHTVEPVAPPEPIWPTPQRPSSMLPPPPDEDGVDDDLLRPTDDPIPLREAFWDPDSVAMPSPVRTRPAPPRWNPNTVALPDATIVVRTSVAVWDPDSAMPPELSRSSSDAPP
jgi:hypothetical protein